MNMAIEYIKSFRKKMTAQQYKTLKGQCLAGDIDGALKGLQKIISRGDKN